ncbi:F0F1 ATP synthase subunit delta [Ostreiculturibacter nitratireducens]|uniref:F0F1 ATP synthase subunit delta n=1 Tax=Ostreiculturibacter nitratireducens TaxID=3075226 RepID=UPI0031B56ECF
MQIDWITVAAQIVNFLVLVWLLNRILYGPVTEAMARREAAIRERFEEAEAREREAAEEAEKLKTEREAAEEARGEQLAAAEAEANQLRQRLEHEAREEIEARRKAWKDQLDKEKGAFVAELRRRAAGHVERVARMVLTDFAGADLEDAMVGTFISRLRALEGEDLVALRAEAKDARGQLSISSAFDLQEAARERLSKALREVLHEGAEVEFQKDEDLICGLRLRVRARTLQWSIDAYLDDLEEQTAEWLEAGGHAPGQKAG